MVALVVRNVNHEIVTMPKLLEEAAISDDGVHTMAEAVEKVISAGKLH